MIEIKRYGNRKLYNTSTKQYITLDEIEGMIRTGADIRITDHTSGKDMTARTFAQILFEREKQIRGSLSVSFLTRLIQAGEESVLRMRSWFPSTLEFSEQVNDEIRERIQLLLEARQLDAAESERWLELLLVESQRIRLIQTGTENSEAPSTLPTKLAVHELQQQLDRLEKVLQKMQDG